MSWNHELIQHTENEMASPTTLPEEIKPITYVDEWTKGKPIDWPSLIRRKINIFRTYLLKIFRV
jgi:hypothetical protein